MSAAVELDLCPNCGVDLTGDPIPERYRHHNTPESPYFDWKEPTHDDQVARLGRCFCLPYGDKTHFRRVIGRDDPAADGIVEWLCPDCGHTWPR